MLLSAPSPLRIHTHAYMHTHGRTDDMHTYIHACTRTDGRTTCIYTYIHAYTRTDGRYAFYILLAVEVSINKEKWVFISVYKQPKVKINTIVTCVDNIMSELSHIDFNIVLFGDFNVNMFNKNNAFVECIDANGLRNLVKTSTCEKGKPSLIDIILTNKSKRFTNTISVDTGLSDFHNLICTSTKFDVPQTKSTTF